jgi:flagellar motor switch protein FliM
MLTKQNLTKEEIDEFERAFGETGPKKRKPAAQVRLYDFEEPDKLSKLNLRALQLVFSSLERPWSGELSSAVRSKASIEINPVHQTAFGAYAESAHPSGAIFELSMDALPGHMFIEMPKTLAAEIVDCMAGGNGEPERIPSSLTRVQKEIIKHFLSRIASAMEKAWKPIADVHFSMSGMHASMDSIDLSANESMLVVGSSWQMNDSEATVNIAMPVSSLEPVIDLLDPQRWLKGGAPSKPASSEPISKLLKSVDMSVSVQLGETQISVRDVLGMEEGDIIKLDAPAGDPLQVRIGGRIRFLARPGLVGKKISAQIVDGVTTNASSDDDSGESHI